MIRDWYLKNLGDAMFADVLVDQIKEIFLSAFESLNCPPNMAAFVRHESDGRLHCELIIYLSPHSTAVAKEINAEKCYKPLPNDLHLLAGSEYSWNTLFPDYVR